MERKKCAFTGHRPHRFPWRGNEADPRCVALKAAMTSRITALVDSGVTDFFTGGAAADILLAVYNGIRRSGTGATVNYARKLGREIIVIDPLRLNADSKTL